MKVLNGCLKINMFQINIFGEIRRMSSIHGGHLPRINIRRVSCQPNVIGLSGFLVRLVKV